MIQGVEVASTGRLAVGMPSYQEEEAGQYGLEVYVLMYVRERGVREE